MKVHGGGGESALCTQVDVILVYEGTVDSRKRNIRQLILRFQKCCQAFVGVIV